jgi:hypothetical protein
MVGLHFWAFFGIFFTNSSGHPAAEFDVVCLTRLDAEVAGALQKFTTFQVTSVCSGTVKPGVNVTITIFSNHSQILAKKLAFFLKTTMIIMIIFSSTSSTIFS